MRGLPIEPGRQLVVAVDTLVRDRHYSTPLPAGDLGHKCLAVNLSDMAAMGADPLGCRLVGFDPHPDDRWRRDVLRGVAALAERFDVVLVGADWRSGAELISIEVYATVPTGQFLTRAGARPGDRIFVSGSLGDAALVYRHRNGTARQQAATVDALAGRLDRPEPRVALGRLLHGIASSAIDVLDGLAQDLGHILRRSGCGADLDTARLPRSPMLRDALGTEGSIWLALTGGDDYELCFTVPPGHCTALADAADQAGVTVTEIGTIRTGTGLTLRGPVADLRGHGAGFDHFSSS